MFARQSTRAKHIFPDDGQQKLNVRELTLNLSKLVIKQWRLALLRGVSVAVAQLCYYSAIGVLDLATVSTLGQTNAFFVVILSVIIIGEKVGIWRWAALLLGFLGAMLILRPGTDSFSIYALLPICAAFLKSCADRIHQNFRDTL